MQLTKAQIRNLQLYATYHAEPPTFWDLFRQNLTRYVVILVLIILLFLLAPTSGIESLALIFTGIFLGILIRDITRFRQFLQMWPATSTVLDWQRLDELFGNDAEDRHKDDGD